MGREDQSPNVVRQRRTPNAPKGVWTSQSDYRAAVDKITNRQATANYLSTRNWQLYFILSFANPVSEECARKNGIAFAERLGLNAYAAVFWGEGTVGGRLHIHVLAGGIWTGHMPPRHKALWIGQIAKRWKHGQVVKSEAFDPRRGNLASYLPDHHEMEIVGTPKRYRVRHRRE